MVNLLKQLRNVEKIKEFGEPFQTTHEFGNFLNNWHIIETIQKLLNQLKNQGKSCGICEIIETLLKQMEHSQIGRAHV